MRWMAVLATFVFGCAAENQETQKSAPPTQKEYDQAASSGVTQDESEAIEALFKRKVADLNSCWQDEYERTGNRKLEGNVTVGLTVKPGGRAHNVRILESSIKSPDLEKCVVSTVTGWGFPEVSGPCPYMRTVHLGAQY